MTTNFRRNGSEAVAALIVIPGLLPVVLVPIFIHLDVLLSPNL